MAWRGRGRGRGGPPPFSGSNGADTEPEGPPPLFPEVHLPEVPPATPGDLILLQHWRSLTRSFQTSCYRIDGVAEKRKVADDPYATSKDAAGGAQKAPLTSILTLDAKYFPEELFSSAEKRAAALASTLRPPDQKRPSGEADIFERFAALEKSGARAEDVAGSERRAGGSSQPTTEGQRGQDNEDGEEELGDEDEEEEGFNDEMDLVMNENYDDDEGYMDDDDGGDGEGIF